MTPLFGTDTDTLLENEKEGKTVTQEDVSMGKTGRMPWIFIGISVLCILVYSIQSVLTDHFSIGIFICAFILCVPIQLFVHVYFSNALKDNYFYGLAGFDDKIEYNTCEVKKLLIQIDLHIGVLSTVFIFLLCVLNSIDLKMQWLNDILIVVYVLIFIASIVMCNYKVIDKIYCREDDKKRARRSIPITALYTFLICAGAGLMAIVFIVKGTENNTLPAMKLCGLLFLGIISATIGLLLENYKIKKWNPANTNYKTSKVSILSLLICVIMYGLMCIV